MEKPVYIYLRLMLHSNLIIASAAVLLCMATEVQVGYTPAFQSFHLLVFTGTLSEYSFHRLLKYYSLNRGDRKERYPRMFSNQTVAWLFLLIPLTAFVISFLYIEALLKWIIMLSGVITLLYSLPVKGPVGILSLRRIPFLKTFFVTLIWSVVTVIVPLAVNSGGIPEGKASWIFIERLFLIFPLALLFDIRDADQDREDGIRTIPVIFGEKLTRKLALLFVLLFAFIVPLLTRTFDLHSHFMPAILWSIPVLWFIFRKPGVESPLLYALLLDGSLILYGTAVVSGGYIFNLFITFQWNQLN